MTANGACCDLIINTVPQAEDCQKYLALLAQGGTIVQLGLFVEPHKISQFDLIG